MRGLGPLGVRSASAPAARPRQGAAQRVLNPRGRDLVSGTVQKATLLLRGGSIGVAGEVLGVPHGVDLGVRHCRGAGSDAARTGRVRIGTGHRLGAVPSRSNQRASRWPAWTRSARTSPACRVRAISSSRPGPFWRRSRDPAVVAASSRRTRTSPSVMRSKGSGPSLSHSPVIHGERIATATRPASEAGPGSGSNRIGCVGRARNPARSVARLRQMPSALGTTGTVDWMGAVIGRCGGTQCWRSLSAAPTGSISAASSYSTACQRTRVVSSSGCPTRPRRPTASGAVCGLPLTRRLLRAANVMLSRSIRSRERCGLAANDCPPGFENDSRASATSTSGSQRAAVFGASSRWRLM